MVAVRTPKRWCPRCVRIIQSQMFYFFIKCIFLFISLSLSLQMDSWQWVGKLLDTNEFRHFRRGVGFKLLRLKLWPYRHEEMGLPIGHPRFLPYGKGRGVVTWPSKRTAWYGRPNFLIKDRGIRNPKSVGGGEQMGKGNLALQVLRWCQCAFQEQKLLQFPSLAQVTKFALLKLMQLITMTAVR